MEEFGEGLRAPKEIELTGRLTESTNLDSLDSQSLTHQPKSKHQLVLSPLLHICLAVSKVVACLWNMFSYSQAALSSFSGKRCTYLCRDLMCQGRRIPRRKGISILSEENWSLDRGIVGRRVPEGVAMVGI